MVKSMGVQAVPSWAMDRLLKTVGSRHREVGKSNAYLLEIIIGEGRLIPQKTRWNQKTIVLDQWFSSF